MKLHTLLITMLLGSLNAFGMGGCDYEAFKVKEALKAMAQNNSQATYRHFITVTSLATFATQIQPAQQVFTCDAQALKSRTQIETK